MTKTVKDNMLKMLSENLAMFFPKLRGHFMCPTCLAKFPAQRRERISEAHIIPKAASGTVKTLLCTDCNSHFGSHQDRWFGEILRMVQNPPASLFCTNIQEGHFFVDNLRVNGHWGADLDKKELRFYWDAKRNSPDVNRTMRRKMASHVPMREVRVPFPVLKESHLIDVGFLTAGYLMFFAMFGYSWVLQAHLVLQRYKCLQ